MTRRTSFSCLLAAAALALALPAQAQKQHAHVHGKLELAIVIDGPTITIEMESPLDNIVGFERAPRTDAEKKAVEDAVAQLRAADQLFRIDPAAGCKLGPVKLESATLGLGKEAKAKGEHDDLEASFAFNCGNAAQAKFIDLDLFNAFKGARQIEAEIVTPDGQFKRTLRRPNAKLSWGK